MGTIAGDEPRGNADDGRQSRHLPHLRHDELHENSLRHLAPFRLSG
jgi:hypothetical protein